MLPAGTHLGCCPCPWSGRLDPVSSRFPWVLGAGHRQRRREPAGERARGGAAGAAGEGGKAHPAGTRGTTAAAWRSSPGYPAWNPRPGTLLEPEAVPQTEWPAAAASSAQRLCRAVGCTLREACCEVGNLIARSTGWEAAVASWPGGPSYDPARGAGARAPAPWAPSPLAPWRPGQRGCRSTGLDVHGSGTCRAGTCVLAGPPSPPVPSPGARCAVAGGSPAGTGRVGRWRQVGGRSYGPGAGSPAGGPARPHGPVPCTPASPECPAGAHGARSVPRLAVERGGGGVGLSKSHCSCRAWGTAALGRRSLPAWQSAGAAAPALRDGAQALAESCTV